MFLPRLALLLILEAMIYTLLSVGTYMVGIPLELGVRMFLPMLFLLIQVLSVYSILEIVRAWHGSIQLKLGVRMTLPSLFLLMVRSVYRHRALVYGQRSLVRIGAVVIHVIIHLGSYVQLVWITLMTTSTLTIGWMTRSLRSTWRHQQELCLKVEGCRQLHQRQQSCRSCSVSLRIG